MEGCRDLDTLQLPYRDQQNLQSIQTLAEKTLKEAPKCYTVRRVTTRAQAKREAQSEDSSNSDVEPQTDQQGASKEVKDSKGSPDPEAQSSRGETPTSLLEELPTGLLTEEDTPPNETAAIPSEKQTTEIDKTSGPTGPNIDQANSQQADAGDDTAPDLEVDSGDSDDQSWIDGPVTRATTRRREAKASAAKSTGGARSKVPTEKTTEPVASSSRGEAANTPEEQERLEQFFKEQLPTTWSDEAIAYLQQRDPSLQQVKTWLETGTLPSWKQVSKESVAVKTWWARYDQLLLSKNGILYYLWAAEKPSQPVRHRVIAVPSMQKAIMSELHDAKTAGHLGEKKTIERLRRSPFYWPGMNSYGKMWVKGCKVCASRKFPKYAKRSPLQNYRVGSTMDRVSIDLVGPFHPRTKRGNSWILTVTDQYTRWAEAFALRDAKAPEIARRVVEFVCRMGMPLELHSDQGRNVDGEVVREMCKLLGIRKTHTTAYHPQGNAITERENSVIKAMLSAYVNERLTDWDDHLPAVMMAHRTAVHRTLDEAPFTMMMGRWARLPLDAFVGPPPEEEAQQIPASEYVASLMEAMQNAHAVVSEHMEVKYASQKKQYDRKVKAEEYKAGQPVWLRVFPSIRGRSKSLQRPWDGPWIVTEVLSDVTHRIQKVPRGWSPVVHGDRLKAYLGELTDPKAKAVQAAVQDKAANVRPSRVEANLSDRVATLEL
jgi:transposase InsO family protein